MITYLVPPNLPLDHAFRECFDTRSLDVPCDAGAVWIEVRGRKDRNLVAAATFGGNVGVVQADTVEVMPPYRKLKIAKRMYQRAAVIFEAPVVPSKNLSEDAKEFWKGRRQMDVPRRILRWWWAMSSWIRCFLW